MDKLISVALPLLGARPAVRLVHLYKLLCGGTFDRSSSSNALPLTLCLRQETVKTGMQQCEGSFVADAPAECAVRPTSSAQVGPSAVVRCDLPRCKPQFLGHYSELHHANVSLLIKKMLVHSHGTFRTQSGKFMTRPRVTQITKWCFQCILVHPILS